MGKTIIVKGDRSGYIIDQSNKTWIFDESCHIRSTGNGIRVAEGTTNTTIILKGTSEAASSEFSYSAIVGLGEGCSITIARGAKAFGVFGAITSDENSRIDNFGTSNAIRVLGDGSVATNAGRITSDITGLSAWEADGCKLVNETSGRIDVSYESNIYASAMRLNTLDGQSGTAINKGTILSGDIGGGLGDDTFINRGTLNNNVAMFDGEDKVDNRGGIIKGFVATGADNDVIDNRGGVIKGIISSDAGDDTLITNKATDFLTEASDGGVDTVQSTASYTLNANVEVLRLIGTANINGTATDSIETREFLFGNAGANTLNGLGGRDVLEGGKGRDVLIGGGDLDLFVFKKGFGIDTVRDFHSSESDHVILEGFRNLGDIEDLQGRIKQHGADAWLTMGDGDTLILKGVDGSLLTNEDFAW